MSKEIFIISGTMGSGKDTVLKKLKKEKDFFLMTTTTSRSMRENEKEGDPYYFIDKEKFKKLIGKDALLEYSKVYDNYYGLTKDEFWHGRRSKKKIFLRVDGQGIKKIKKLYPDSVSIFIAPPSIKEIKRRISSRGNINKKIVKQRLKAAENQIKELVDCNCDYIIINNNIKETVEKIKRIVF